MIGQWRNSESNDIAIFILANTEKVEVAVISAHNFANLDHTVLAETFYSTNCRYLFTDRLIELLVHILNTEVVTLN